MRPFEVRSRTAMSLNDSPTRMARSPATATDTKETRSSAPAAFSQHLCPPHEGMKRGSPETSRKVSTFSRPQ